MDKVNAKVSPAAMASRSGLITKNSSSDDNFENSQATGFPQAEFATISCRSLRAASLRECLRYEALRIIATAVTASTYLADENDAAAIEAFRRLWPIVKTDIAIPAAELDRLSGGAP
jgi:hypothetical protein